MLVSVEWLEELIGIKLQLDKMKKVCLNLGLEIEDESHLAPEHLTIGEINAITPHPRLKNLTILQVKTSKNIQIVTAAKNVKKGDLVLVGPAGGELNGQTILEKDFDGVKSQGVLISEQELGLTERSVAVIVLKKGKPGKRFKDVFDDLVVDVSTTPNRPDWLSVQGIARELGTGLDTGRAIRTSSNSLYNIKQPNRTGSFKIEIRDLQGCPRYTARIFDNVEVKESPFWMKWRLHCMGMKPINNIVDITNLVMLLTGQSLHPFDLDIIKGSVIIRKAKKGEELSTLEGTKLTLSKNDLVIADRMGPIALAGVIGSARTQISNSTKRILLESAYFDPKRIAHTSRRLGLMTEASMRFEQGADISIADRISAITADLFKTYAHVKEREFISSGKKGKTVSIKFTATRLNEILSLALTPREIKQILEKIDIQTTGKNILLAKIPHYRRDLKIEEDIYEEVARLFGYMNIPETVPKRWGGCVKINKNRVYEDTIRNYLVGQGFSETYNLSLVASTRLSDFGFNKFAKIKNPLNERFDALRPTLFIGLLDCINYNLSKGNRSLKFFEMGNILTTGSPYQEKRLGIVLGGERFIDSWNKKNELTDYYDAKGVVENIFNLLHVKEVKFQEIAKKGFSQTVDIVFSGKHLGYLGCIEKELCKEPYYYIELRLAQILPLVAEAFYMPPAKFPANTRDLSFLVNEKVEAPALFDLMTKVGGPILEKITLFDYYKGKNLPLYMKSFGFRLHFRAPDRTLADKEVDIFVKKIEQDVSEKFDAKLRKRE